MAYSADGWRALSAGADGIRVWEVDTGGQLEPVAVAEAAVGFRSVAFSPDARRVLAYARPKIDDGRPAQAWPTGLQLWDVEARRQLHRFGWDSPTVVRPCFAPDGRRFVWAWAGRENAPGRANVHSLEFVPGFHFQGFGLWDTEDWVRTADVWGFNVTLKHAPGTPSAVVFPAGGMRHSG